VFDQTTVHPGPNKNIPGIPEPLADVGALSYCVRAIKMGVDSLSGKSGKPTDRAVTFNDLIDYGALSSTAATSEGGTVGGGGDVIPPVAPVQPSDLNPLPDGTAAPGASVQYSRGDHVHPTDESRAPIDSPMFTGTPTTTEPPVNDSSPMIATTEFVMHQIAASSGPPPAQATPLMAQPAGNVGVSVLYAREDHIHPQVTPLLLDGGNF